MRVHSEAEPIYMRSKLDMWTLKCHADTLLLHRSRQTSQLQLLCLYTYDLTKGGGTPSELLSPRDLHLGVDQPGNQHLGTMAITLDRLRVL